MKPEKLPTTFAELLASISLDEAEQWIERAAIMQYDGGMPRDRAEREALALWLKRKAPQVRLF